MTPYQTVQTLRAAMPRSAAAARPRKGTREDLMRMAAGIGIRVVDGGKS